MSESLSPGLEASSFRARRMSEHLGIQDAFLGIIGRMRYG